MNKICEYLCMIYNNNYINNNNIKTNITYYVRLSPEDIISCDTSNNIDIINYMSEIINKFSTQSLEKIFFELGEERFSKQIVRAIDQARKTQKITTTAQLAKIVSN